MKVGNDKLYNFVEKYILRTIENDDFKFIVIWGPLRKGKSTLALDISYIVYDEDWNKAWASVVMQLSEFIYKLKMKIPEGRWDKKKYHYRVPLSLYDDMASWLNKAATKNDPMMDSFKQYLPTIGTHLGILLGTMDRPENLTQQLVLKYDIDILVSTRGKFKADKVAWMKDYYGWKPIHHKRHIVYGEFYEVPEDVYRQYDERRMSLSEELRESILDNMMRSKSWIMKMLDEEDLIILRIIKDTGTPTPSVIIKRVGNEIYNRDRIQKLRRLGLVFPVYMDKNGKVMSPYGTLRYTLTDFGLRILDEVRKEERNVVSKAYSP